MTQGGAMVVHEPHAGLAAAARARHAGFWLKKWYVDAADAGGNVFIGYSAAARWKKLSLHYYEHLWRTAAGAVASKSAFASRAAPAWQAAGRLSWSSPDLQAEWISTGTPQLSERLLDTARGSIIWRCFQPKARATITLAGLSFSGWGYTECLELTIRPWQLPFNKLYWGRCHSDHHYLVWIKWDGPTRQSLLWHDGECTAEFDLSSTGISTNSIALELQTRSALREGLIRSTVFRSLGKIAALVPAQALSIDEHKWFGTGRVVAEGHSEPATAIYEEVIW